MSTTPTTPRTITVWRRASTPWDEGGDLAVLVHEGTVAVESTDDHGCLLALWKMSPAGARSLASGLTDAADRVEQARS